MKKEGCICCSITTLLVIIGTIVLILYFTLGSGDNGGNNVNIDDKGGKGRQGGDNNIIQKTSQGGIHFLECYGNLHVNWKALLAVGAIILAILITKWAIQHNWCRVFKVCQKKNKKTETKKGQIWQQGH